jgi:hypothetical protein
MNSRTAGATSTLARALALPLLAALPIAFAMKETCPR